MHRKHRDIIIAWLDGAEIEYLDSISKNWYSIEEPTFKERYEYRIAQPKLYQILFKFKNEDFNNGQHFLSNKGYTSIEHFMKENIHCMAIKVYEGKSQ